jgi:DNA-binding response OmpR family regulator
MKAKILVVDDAAEIRELLVFILEGGGYQVSLAEDAVSVKKAFSEPQPDIVILDLKLPDVNGLDLLPQIKKEWRRQVIVLEMQLMMRPWRQPSAAPSIF